MICPSIEPPSLIRACQDCGLSNSAMRFLVPDANAAPHDDANTAPEDGLRSADMSLTLGVGGISDVGDRRLFDGVAKVEGTTDRDDEIDAKAQQMESDAKAQAQAHGEQEALREKDPEFLFQDEADASRQGKLNHVLKSRVDVHRTSLMVNRVEVEMQQQSTSAQRQRIWSKILQ